MCKCVLYYCHQVSTQLQLTNIYVSISNSCMCLVQVWVGRLVSWKLFSCLYTPFQLQVTNDTLQIQSLWRVFSYLQLINCHLRLQKLFHFCILYFLLSYSFLCSLLFPFSGLWKYFSTDVRHLWTSENGHTGHLLLTLALCC